MPISTIGTAGLAASTTLTTPTLASANITTALTLTGASGTNGQFLTSAGSGSVPTWTTAAASQWTTSGANIYYSTGKVGIGTSSPSSALHISGTALSDLSDIKLQNTASGGGTWRIGDGVGGSAGSLSIYDSVAGATRLNIGSGGRVGIGTTSPAGPLEVSGTGAISTFTQTAGGDYCITTKPFTNGGTYYAMAFYAVSQVGAITSSTSTTSYNTTSDYRLKENIAPMTGALTKVSLLKPVTYKWKIDGSNGQGFIAHELQEVIPDAVVGSKDAVDADGNPIHQMVDTSFLVATLTAAIQELKAINDTQAATITALTARITALESRT